MDKDVNFSLSSTVFSIIIVMFLFHGEPDIFDMLREKTINLLKDNERSTAVHR